MNEQYRRVEEVLAGAEQAYAREVARYARWSFFGWTFRGIRGHTVAVWGREEHEVLLSEVALHYGEIGYKDLCHEILRREMIIGRTKGWAYQERLGQIAEALREGEHHG